MTKIAATKIMTIADMDKHRDKWRGIRYRAITGTDAGTIMGVNPYDTPLSLYYRKMWGDNPPQGASLDLQDNEAMYWGRQLEDIVAKEFCFRTGLKVRKCGMMRNKYAKWRVADVDRLIVNFAGGLECKTTTAFNDKAWGVDKIPPHYRYQCLHYILTLYCNASGDLLIDKPPVWAIACLIGGQKYVMRTIEYTQEDLLALAKAEYEFYMRIINATPPDVSNRKIDQDILAMLDGGDDTIGATEYIEDTMTELVNNEALVKAYKDKVQMAKNRLVRCMINQKAGTCVGDIYKMTYKSIEPRETCSMADIKAHPDIYKQLKDLGIIKQSKATKRLTIKRYDDEDRAEV